MAARSARTSKRYRVVPCTEDEDAVNLTLASTLRQLRGELLSPAPTWVNLDGNVHNPGAMKQLTEVAAQRLKI